MEIYKKGSRGEMVVQIQKALHLYPDGIFGDLTREAVTAWQRENGLTADGIVGPATLAKMFPAVAKSALGMKKSKRVITDIVIHCTASKPGSNLTAADIRRSHIRERGWADIGYHYVVRIDGTVENGRDIDKIGAHVSGYNSHSIGIVYVGGLDANGKPKDTRNEAQKNALLNLLLDLRKLYPKAKISGHRDFSPDKNKNGIIEPAEWIKSCPCFDAKYEYRNV
jgi:N-acetyl-anhydromuramyl-L-alanine amidase AmpD